MRPDIQDNGALVHELASRLLIHQGRFTSESRQNHQAAGWVKHVCATQNYKRGPALT